MRRIVLTSLASTMLALVIPGVASAHSGHRHHHGSGAHHVRAHHPRRAHTVRFGSPATPPSTQPPSADPAPTVPATPPTAGTVASFANGVLTLTLADGSSVTGKVTADTRLTCEPAVGVAPQPGEDQNDGMRGDGRDGQSDQNDEHGQQGEDNDGHGNSQQEQGNEGQGNDDGAQAGCDTTALTQGTVVREAELQISSSGAVWLHVELIK